jgi:large subunit ribosomal protein L22
MKAYLHSVRIAPKKANLLARMVRGLSVPEAMDQLTRTNKKAARIMETLLRSAIANASHNDKQDPQTMVIKTVIVNQGQAYHRGMPKARGQMRPYRKFLSHITLTLGLPGEKMEPQRRTNTPKTDKPVRKPKTQSASQLKKNEVQRPGSSAAGAKKTVKKKADAGSASSDSSVSA